MSETISETDATRLKSVLSAEVKTWHFLLFANVTAAINFVNASPAQGAGEAAFCCMGNGQIGVFYFL